MNTITITRQNAFTKLSKLVSLLDTYKSLEISYQKPTKKIKEVKGHPTDDKLYDQMITNMNKKDYVDLEDFKTEFYKKKIKKTCTPLNGANRSQNFYINIPNLVIDFWKRLKLGNIILLIPH
ncbi:MAG TPA: hypothetical protein PK048_00060 [Candidatus Absconditabacterales bacterium]|nr:hypothetical protein [Candidatus Absconditabacterales bacterium]